MRTDLQPRFAELTDEVRASMRNFTEQELKDILAFYKTTAGKKFSRAAEDRRSTA